MPEAQATNPDALVEYGFRRVIITVTAILCALLEIIDVTIVNVALNDMGGSLGVSLNDIAWVITAYAIANVIIIPMTSWLSKQFGRKNYFAGSIILFTAASFFCGNATTLSEIIIFRFLQGMGGGALLVTAQTIITESYPQAKRGMAQAIYGMGVIAGPTLGPPLGGYIIDHFSWRDIFFINVPLGIIATILTITFIRSPEYGKKLSVNQVDWWGILFLTAFIGSLQYILEHGQQDDWFSNSTIVILGLIFIFGFVLFIWREMVYEHPIVNLRVLRNINLRIGTILTLVLGFGLFGSNMILPVYTQSVLGWTATDAGLLMIPGTIATGLLMPIIGKMLERGFSPKYLMATGLIIYSIFSYWMFHLITIDTGKDALFWPIVIRGIGMGMLFVPMTTLALSTLQGKNIGEGASFTSMMRQLGGSLGIAIITTEISRLTQIHRVDLLPNLNTASFLLQERVQTLQQGFIAKGYSFNNALEKAYKSIEGAVMLQSTVLTYMDIFLLIGVLFLICVPFVLIFINKNAGRNLKDPQD